jgi:hypothetical protein
MTPISELIEKYQDWLKDRTILRDLEGWTQITTPYLDRHNDYVQIYVRRDGDSYLLTDDGHTLTDLAISGCAIDTPHRKRLLALTLSGFGVELADDELVVRAVEHNFPLRKHSLIQAVLAVNDLYVVADPIVRGIFIEDVAKWLDAEDIRYVARVNLIGISKFPHVFDFAIPKSRVSPERLIRAIGNPTRDRAEGFAFAWLDTREVRPHDAEAIAIVNDNERIVPSTVIDALNNYGIKTVKWSERASALQQLVA